MRQPKVARQLGAEMTVLCSYVHISTGRSKERF
jgi:hypothetical protein